MVGWNVNVAEEMKRNVIKTNEMSNESNQWNNQWYQWNNNINENISPIVICIRQWRLISLFFSPLSLSSFSSFSLTSLHL